MQKYINHIKNNYYLEELYCAKILDQVVKILKDTKLLNNIN